MKRLHAWLAVVNNRWSKAAFARCERLAAESDAAFAEAERRFALARGHAVRAGLVRPR